MVSDGAPGIVKAIETCFPRSARQRCLAHRMRNLVAKVPDDVWPEFKGRVTAAYQAPSRAIARDLAEGMIRDYAKELPSPERCFEDDFEACIAHLRMPINHRRPIRTMNLLERLFLEERRRLKVLPHAFGERPILKLMFAAMTRARSAGARSGSPTSSDARWPPPATISTPNITSTSASPTRLPPQLTPSEYPATLGLDRDEHKKHPIH